MNDQALKLALARELPELISVHECMPICDESHARSELVNGVWRLHCDSWIIEWLDTGKEVTEREWDWVAWYLCEKLLKGKSFELCDALDAACFYNDSLKCCATWQQRAIAYFKTIGKAIE